MLKKTLLSTLLLLSNIAAAQIKVNFDLTIENQETTRTVTCNDAILEENTIASLVNDDLIFDILAQKNDDTVTIQANVYEKSEEGVALVATLNTTTALDQTATITAGERSADENYNVITLVITPSQVE